MAIATVTFEVSGMHCGSCALLIDDALEDLPGVNSTHTSVKAGRTVVDLDPDQVGVAEVVATISELGYQATPAS
ncbi:heavy-metal-associated domain-containing protein [Kribbella catacumbae]|uniref:heavy-metal-associated domain-containing protein n=1 Tax=Kribbella catacumbae TaxID=460086 RepID=UPI0003623DEC|nr:cation transporter [Kribbella catacumbae]